MGRRGRTSRAALSVVPPVGSLERAAVPKELTVEEAVEWRILINAVSADQYPPDTHAALVQLCRHTVNARRVADLKRHVAEQGDVDAELKLMKVEEEQSRVIVSIMTKLRLTPQSRYDAKKKRGTISAHKPWDFGG